jgi:hypothetical protein
MEVKESVVFAELLMAYKDLWVEHATLKYLRTDPAGSEAEAREHLQDMADAAVLPVSAALLSGSPLLDTLRGALRTLPPR